MVTTPTGIPIQHCGTCRHTHPITRRHCARCGLATLFGHDRCRAGTSPKEQS